LTWSSPVTISLSGSPDKDWIACDNTASSPYYGHCYAVWADLSLNDRLLASVSIDGGATWGPAVSTVNNAVGYDVQPVRRPDGTVVVVATLTSSLIAYRSTNGGASWTAPVTFNTRQNHVVKGMKALHKPTAAVDGAGTVYAVWEDCRFRSGCSSNDLIMATSA